MHMARISIGSILGSILLVTPPALPYARGEEPAAPAPAPAPAPTAIAIEAEKAVIENSFIAIEMSTAAKKLRTRSITNKITGATTAFEGNDFVMVLAGGTRIQESDLALEKVTEEAADGVPGLAFELAGETMRIRMRLVLGAQEWWATRWLEIEGGQGRLEKLSMSEWRTQGTYGPPGPGKTIDGLGAPQGYGQAAYVDDLFFAIEHPGAENFGRGKRIACRISAFDELGTGKKVVSRRFVAGAGEAGGASRAFVRFIGERRANPARMVFLVNDWYWTDKSRTRESIEAVAKAKMETGVPVDSFTLDDGWDLRDGTAPLWTRLDPARFPGGWQSLADAARPAGIGMSLWFGPIGGYGGRDRRVALGKAEGLEVNGDKLCLAGTKYRERAAAIFSSWATNGMDYIKVDGFWPDCKVDGHGHPTGDGCHVAQMDALMEAFAAWRKARPGLLIAYTSGSNPSPFWLQHADFVWRGGADDEHAGEGDPFDRHSTYIDSCLQAHRPTDMPISAFVTFDIVQPRLQGTSDAAFERNAWWLAARTSLHHDWYVQASDLSAERWKVLERSARWAKAHEKLFRLGRMVGSDPRQGGIYGFSAFEGGKGVLSLRNPSSKPGTLEQALSRLLFLPRDAAKKNYRLTGVHGETKALEGVHGARAALKVELPALSVAIFEVTEEP